LTFLEWQRDQPASDFGGDGSLSARDYETCGLELTTLEVAVRSWRGIRRSNRPGAWLHGQKIGCDDRDTSQK